MKFRNPVQFGKANIFLWEGNSECQHHRMVVCRTASLDIAVIICRVSCYVTHTKLFHYAVYIVCFANKHNIVRCLVGWNNDKLLMDFSLLSSNIWIIKHRFMSARHGSAEYWTTSVYKGHYLLNPFRQVSTSTFSFLAQHRAYSSTESKINLEFGFQVKDLGCLYLRPSERMSLILLILTLLRSPVMIWPAGL